ncbi:squalene/phytoene synthase family protein [Bartonella sp. DGB1]|uniref:squalene/phytoene synthase family protein n=1 Tax=Bartonella sp. DGB1 TaxID=3239807 RepID=UPI0035235E0C
MSVSFLRQLKDAQYHQYLALLYAPIKLREPLAILYNFHYEISRLLYQTSNRDLAKIKVQWWIDIFEKLKNNENVSSYTPLVKKINLLINDYQLPVEKFIEYCNSQLSMNSEMKDIEDFTIYAEKTRGNILYLAIRIFLLNRKNNLSFDSINNIITKAAIILLGQDILRNFYHPYTRRLIPEILFKAVAIDSNLTILQLSEAEQKKIYKILCEFIFSNYKDFTMITDVLLKEANFLFLPISLTKGYYDNCHKFDKKDLVNFLSISKLKSQLIYFSSFYLGKFPILGNK